MKGCSHDDVARRAYELFLSRGAQHGSDLEDWLQAERQLSSNGSNGAHGNGSHPAPSRSAPPRARAPRAKKAR